MSRIRSRDEAAARLAADVVSNGLDVAVEEIVGIEGGSSSVAFAQQVAMYLCHVAFDWSPGPRAAQRASGQEAALGAHCDAQRRVNEALDALAAPLRRVVERVCLQEAGLEATERGENWPARSGKVALKLGLAQLAASRASR